MVKADLILKSETSNSIICLTFGNCVSPEKALTFPTVSFLSLKTGIMMLSYCNNRPGSFGK